MEKYKLISLQFFGNLKNPSLGEGDDDDKLDLGRYDLSTKGPFVDLSEASAMDSEHRPGRIRRMNLRGEAAERRACLRCLVCYAEIAENRNLHVHHHQQQQSDEGRPENIFLPTFVNLLLGKTDKEKDDLHSNHKRDGNNKADGLKSMTKKLTSLRGTKKIAYLCNNCNTASRRFVRAYHAWKKLGEQISEMRAKFRNAIKLSMRFAEIDGSDKTESTSSNNFKIVLEAVQNLRKCLLPEVPDSSCQSGIRQDKGNKRKQQQQAADQLASTKVTSVLEEKRCKMSRQQRWAKIQDMYPGISQAKYNELVRKKREEKQKLSLEMASGAQKTISSVGIDRKKASGVTSKNDPERSSSENRSRTLGEDESAVTPHEDAVLDPSSITSILDSEVNPQYFCDNDNDDRPVSPMELDNNPNNEDGSDLGFDQGNVFDEREVADLDQDTHLNLTTGSPPQRKEAGTNREETEKPEKISLNSNINLEDKPDKEVKKKRNLYCSRLKGIHHANFHTKSGRKRPLSNTPSAIRVRKLRAQYAHLSSKEFQELKKQQNKEKKKPSITPEQREKNLQKWTKIQEQYPGITHNQYVKLRKKIRAEEQKVSSDGIPGIAGVGGGMREPLRKVTGEDGQTRYFYKKDFEIKIKRDDGEGGGRLLYSCGVCGESRGWFKRQNCIRKHINKRHIDLSNALACDFCERKFYYHFDLQRHRQLAHRVGNSRFPCEICGEIFIHNANRMSHKRIVHDGIKPHVCEHCGKAFGAKKDMLLHVRRHTGEKPFVCHVCGDAFFDKQSMKKHLLRKHPEAAKDLPPPANRGRSKVVLAKGEGDEYDVKVTEPGTSIPDPEPIEDSNGKVD